MDLPYVCVCVLLTHLECDFITTALVFHAQLESLVRFGIASVALS